MKQEVFTLNLSRCIFEYISEDYALTLQEKKTILTAINSNSITLEQINLIIQLIIDSINRTPINVIPFKNEH